MHGRGTQEKGLGDSYISLCLSIHIDQTRLSLLSSLRKYLGTYVHQISAGRKFPLRDILT